MKLLNYIALLGLTSVAANAVVLNISPGVNGGDVPLSSVKYLFNGNELDQGESGVGGSRTNLPVELLSVTTAGGTVLDKFRFEETLK